MRRFFPDQEGVTLFKLWLKGNVDMVTCVDDEIASYLSKNMILKGTIQRELHELAKTDSPEINKTIPTEIENGYLTGMRLKFNGRKKTTILISDKEVKVEGYTSDGTP